MHDWLEFRCQLPQPLHLQEKNRSKQHIVGSNEWVQFDPNLPLLDRQFEEYQKLRPYM